MPSSGFRHLQLLLTSSGVFYESYVHQMHKSRGNALFLILIAVALFAALSYAVTKSDRSGKGVEKEQAVLLASSFMEHGAQVAAAINRLKLINNCTDDQISFENSVDTATDYANPNAPADKRCHVFHPDGSNVPFIHFGQNTMLSTYLGGVMALPLFVTGGTAYAADGVGSIENDVWMVISGHPGYPAYDQLFLQVCNSTMRQAGQSNSVDYNIYDGAVNASFKGTFIPREATYDALRSLNIAPFPVVCARASTPGWYRVAMPVLVR